MISKLNINDAITFETVELIAWESYEVETLQIITVVEGKVTSALLPAHSTFESNIFHKWTLKAKEDTLLSVIKLNSKDIALNKVNVDEEFWDFCRSNWSQLRDLWDVEGFENVDLYRSDQEIIEYKWTKYKLNFWFCWANVDCLWHNVHEFIETHTNVVGHWNMQISEDWTDQGLMMTYGLAPGQSHKTFNLEGQFDEDWNPKYPFHRWLWGPTWNIWLAIEKYKD